jgi:formate hydrogenlyase subunit 3/multisubunit Na+/H+ antiporter MnhD subunit
MAFQANGLKAAAALAFTAALFHALNHSFFKSLLFFGAGAVLTATGERDMDKLGGLIHRMPFTSFVVLVGCVAISALPPFNGFVSEWLIFQAVLQSPDLPQWALKIMVPAVGAMLAFAAALAAACFSGGRAVRQPKPPPKSIASRSRPCSFSPRSACWPESCRGWRSTRLRRSRPRSWAAACRRRPGNPGFRSCRLRRAAAHTTGCW